MTDITDTETTYLLPPAAYVDAGWFEAEQRELFERTWAFVGVEHDLRESGDFVTVQVGRVPIVVVRDRDGGLRAFHNMCRHRGLPVVDGDGNCGKAFVCPYHRWNYGLDGSLRSVPQKEQFPELDHDRLGLHEVRCETWKTLVFVHLDADADPLGDWMAGLDSLFGNFHPETLVEVSDQRHEVASNWKLYVENHVDWLHLWYLHADTLGGYDHAAGERHEFGRHWASFEHWTDATRESIADNGIDGGGLLPIAGLDERDASNGAHFVFPSLTLFTNMGYWMLGQVIPVDPTNFRLRLRVFAVEGSNGSAFEQTLNPVMYEDYSATQAIQRAVASPAFEVGPLATSYEREIMRFHQHYLDYVSPPV
jgi:Rieske 2Fe-2S family protein